MRNALAGLTVALVAAVATVGAFARDEAASVADVDVPTARGVALKATLNRPAKGNGVAVVLAPGQGAHRNIPLLTKGAEALAAAGFTVLRFDWAYFTAKGSRSADLVPEVADFDAAVSFAMKQDGISRLIVAGKSLGSMVALRWSNAHPDEAVVGLALLTFPASDPEKPGAPYEGADELAKSDMGPLVLCGDHDPLARLPELYALAAKPQHAPKVVIVPGDHGYATGTRESPETAENVDLVVRHFVVWAKRQIAK